MHRLHLISHTHWDREWYQTFQQFRIRLVHLVDGLLEILDRDEQYQHFMLDGQTIVLEDYLQVRPEREADLRGYVQNGRVLIGPWYILPDEFLVSPEATIRNLLEGERVARRFGPTMKVGYIPDPFGHIGQMPQILRGFGIENASLWRGVADQPNEFWWQSPDGSRVLMGYERDGYGNAAGVVNGGGPEAFVTQVRLLRDRLAAHTGGPDLLLMHGVDHQEASPGTSAAVAYAADHLDGDKMIHSTLPGYFECVRESLDLASLPVVTGELRSPKNAPLLPGVLSARMWIKQRNQACETLLEKWAEPFSAFARLYAGEARPEGVIDRPEDLLREAWRLLMQCHPHDSICGCSIDPVHEEMRPRFDQVEQIGEEITRQSLAALAAGVDTQPGPALGGNPALGEKVLGALVVFNPSPRTRGGVVQATVEGLPESGEFELVDETGRPAAFQSLGMGSGTLRKDSGELFNMNMDRKTFQNIIAGVSSATVIEGGRIQEIRLTRVPSISDPAAPNQPGVAEVFIRTGLDRPIAPEDWERSMAELARLLADPNLQTFHLVARTNPSGQVLLAARGVPGLGFRTYWVREKSSKRDEKTGSQETQRIHPLVRALMPVAIKLAAHPAAQGLIQRFTPDPAGKPPYRIKNEFFTVEALPDGTLSILDRRSGLPYPGQNRFVDGGDRGDTYNYSPPAADRLAAAKLKRVRTERGLVQNTLVLSLEIETPEALADDRQSRGQKTVVTPITSRVTLAAGSTRVEIHTEVDNRARDHRLRVHFDLPFAPRSPAHYDGHFEVVERALGIPTAGPGWVEQPRPEVPQRAYTAVLDGGSAQSYQDGVPLGRAGLLIANRGLPEVEVLTEAGASGSADPGSSIALTLLRCVGWLSRDDLPERPGPAGPGLPTPAAQMPGVWSFDYAVVPFWEPGAPKDEVPSGGAISSLEEGGADEPGVTGEAAASVESAASVEAEAFQSPLRAISATLHDGHLPARAAFLQIEPAGFQLSAVKISEDRRGWLVRGYNPGSRPITLRLKTLTPMPQPHRANLAEETGEALDGDLEVRPKEIVTVRF